MSVLVFKSGEQIELQLEDGDAYSIMKSTGPVRIDCVDRKTLYVNAADILYIYEEPDEEFKKCT